MSLTQNQHFESPPSQSEKLRSAYKNSFCLSYEQQFSTKPNTPETSEADDSERSFNLAMGVSGSMTSFRKFSEWNETCQNIIYNEQPLQIDVQPKRRDFANNEEQQKFIEDYTMQKKTELCKNWVTKGSCKFMDNCSFAHGNNELKDKVHLHQNFKTKACKKYFYKGICNYGNRCQYLHYELAYKPEYKEFALNLLQERNVQLPCLGYEGNQPLEANQPIFDGKTKRISEIQKRLELERLRALQKEFLQKEAFTSTMPKVSRERLPFFKNLEYQTPKKIPLVKISQPFKMQSACQLNFIEEENFVFGGN